ncbi:vitamin K epoxide reductase family protein [Chitinophaga sp. 22536]|uniref:vitamin K epoxide reductase family protein n=1 Tax=unclassified Chitinophaga TaxID=2619133 RepID=UPI003F86D78B
MQLLKIITGRKQGNVFNVCHFLLEMLKVNFTVRGLADALRQHISFPSLLSLKDILFLYGIESVAIQKGRYRYSDFETPFICSIQQEDWPEIHFTIVTRTEADTIEYLNPLTNKLALLSLEEFEKIDKNIILLMDTSAPKHESNLVANRKKQYNGLVAQIVPLFLAFAAAAFAAGNIIFFSTDIVRWCASGFLLSSFLGLATTSLLIWNEVDEHNPFIREVCGGSKKVNCNAILTSSGAALLGISWSVWGFAFFAAFFSIQVLFPADTSFMLICSALSLLAAPYVFFSVYYQWKVAKQWCSLCLTVQVVLAINALIAGYYLWGSSLATIYVTPYSIVIALLTGLFFLFITNTVIPELRNARAGKGYEQKWKTLKYNPQIFGALLDKSERISIPASNMGITLGNPNATNEIIKVCNPYCGPCSKAHPELKHIIQNNPDVKLRIIFIATGENNDKRTAPVAHLLAIQQKYGGEKVQHALDDWYLATDKDYTTFSQKYPMNGELQEQREKIHAMRNWCKTMKIRVTPTIFINGKELPDNYDPAELKNFF